MTQIKGLLFDKDGTLFDFNATWGAWSRGLLTEEAGGDTGVLRDLAAALGYDLDRDVFRPGSVVIAAMVDEVADVILGVLPDLHKSDLIGRMNTKAAEVAQVPVTDLVAYFEGLRQQGYALGIATNDAEAPARRHLELAGVTEHFDFIAGSDSGYGGKPQIGQLTAFCAATGLRPEDCAMVGDSLHDLHAGRAAGMTTIGVLTGPAPRAELAPAADVVLDSIAEIPAWLATTR